MTKDEIETLIAITDMMPGVKCEVKYGEQECFSIKFGPLNLLLCTSERVYDVWAEGTEQLKLMKPIPRDIACQLFKTLRERSAQAANTVESLLDV